MPRLLRLAFAGVMATALALGPVATAAADTTHRQRPLPADKLAGALITVADLPAGFYTMSENPGVAKYISGDPACATMVELQRQMSTNTAPGAFATAEVFLTDLKGSFVWQGFGSYRGMWSTLVFVKLAHATAHCKSFVMELEGGERAEITQLAVSPVAVADMGLHSRFRSTIGAIVLDSDTILARSGRTLLMVNGHLPGRPDLAEDLALKAAANLADANS
ncbi:hypothetical protein [Alloactinosynnema sp. L-07]|uniref:hypothetical protein n=1 Tax=Alloactinosynnema sp. L-07 TaxID=1653480 RepID=UPI00065EF730|nr:hypothetical protein [Alloactinosynnema sp. L-07]CRK56723.1 hypothetical protein [Alloactinosynnema sp. L-07]